MEAFLIILLIVAVVVSIPHKSGNQSYQANDDTPTYPRIIGYNGVYAKGDYYDCDGFYVPPHHEFATVEISPRHYIVMDTLDALRKGIREVGNS
jgi:hypothetical protein